MGAIAGNRSRPPWGVSRHDDDRGGKTEEIYVPDYVMRDSAGPPPRSEDASEAVEERGDPA
jgi:hypothetical protein